MSNCYSCCQFDNECVSSASLTEMFLKDNQAMMSELQNNNHIIHMRKFGVFKKYCYESDCVSLFFRMTKVDEYCILFGKIGTCRVGNKCFVNKVKQIYPIHRRLVTNQKSSAKVLIKNLQYVYVMSFYINCLHNIYEIYVGLVYFL